MDHPFILGGEPDKCVKCRRKELDHSDMAQCEGCPNIGPCHLHLGKIKFGQDFGLLLCETCMKRELEHQSPEAQAEREQAYRKNVISIAKEIDSSVGMKSEYWNNETISIGALADVINADASVTNKRASLFEVIQKRYKEYQQALIKKDEEKNELMNRINASYQYMVTLSNQFTNEERAKYQLADFNYKPIEKVVKPKSPSKQTKFSKADLVAAAEKYSIPMPILQTLCVRFNCNVEEAANRYKETMGVK